MFIGATWRNSREQLGTLAILTRLLPYITHERARRMSKKRVVYEGKAKILYEGPEPGTLIQYFKDDATAFNAQKKAVLDGKGVLNNRISEFMMTRLGAVGIPTHFIRRLNMREQLIKKVEIIPLEVVVRNIAAGTLSTRLGIEEGQVLPRPMVEFYFKDDALGDPLVTEEHIAACRVCLPLWEFVWSISNSSLGDTSKATARFPASSLPMKSVRTAAVSGILKLAKSSTRTASAVTLAA